MIQQRSRTNIQLGTWLTTGSPVIADLVSAFDFNWLLFDMEHGMITEESLLCNLQAVGNKQTTLVVRVGSLHAPLIARVLDKGAHGIMVPHISTASQAEQCVKAMYYPPKGHRGYSSSVRAFRYGLEIPDAITPLLFAQIEDVEGVKNVKAIAAVDGVDVLFVGPADLKLSLSLQASPDAITYEQALNQVLEAARLYGKQMGILVRNHKDIEALKAMGITYMAVDSDTAILKNGYNTIMSAV